MGAMLIGMATGGFALACCAVIVNIVAAVIIFIDARRRKMKAALWLFMALFFGLAVVPFYLIIKMKIIKQKCSWCGAKVDKDSVFCMQCGTKIEK